MALGDSARSFAQIYAQVTQIVGIILLFIPGAQAAGALLFAQSAAIQVGLAITARPPRRESLNNSQHYGIEVTRNPLADDTPIPQLYGTHRMVPILLQEYVSPLSETPAGLVKKQGYSALYGVCLGEVKAQDGIRGVKVNEQPLFSETLTDNFTGNGTKKDWVLSGGFAYLPGISVTVDGTAKANVETSATDTFPQGPQSRTVTIASGLTQTEHYVRLSRTKGDRILTKGMSLTINGTTHSRASLTLPWTVRRVSNRKVDVVFLPVAGVSPPSSSSTIKVTYTYIAAGNCALRQNGRGATTILFPTAPANNAKIVATYRTSFIPRLKFDWRPGTLDQEPIEGFRDNANTDPVSLTLTQDTDRQYDSVKKCDDVRVGIVAPAGLVKFASDGSGYEAANLKVSIRYRTVSAAGTDDPAGWKTLYHLGQTDKPSATYSFWGMTTGKRTWEVSIRETLQELLDAGFTDVGEISDIEAELESLADTRIKVQVTRKNQVLQDGNANVIDGAIFAYATRIVRDAPLSYPGVTLLSIRGLVSEQFSGSSPFVTCIAERADLYDQRTGGTTRSSNAGAAIFDLITSGNNLHALRYGGGHWYTSADIDSTTLNALANACDTTVTEADGSQGFKRVLNLVLDTKMSLSEVVADIAYTAGAFAVQQGLRWRFPLDVDAAASFAFVDSTDPANANIVEGTLEIGQDPLESLPTDLEFEFFNEAKEYQRESVLVAAQSLSPSVPRNTLRVSGIGITRLGEASRRAAELLQQARNVLTVDAYPGSGPSLVTWLAHPGAMLPEAGDVVSVSSTVPGGTVATGWSAQKVRVIVVGRESGTPGEDGAPAMPLVRYIGRTMGSEAFQGVKVVDQGQTGGSGPSASASGASGSTFGYPGQGLAPAWGSAGAPTGAKLSPTVRRVA